MLQTYWLRNSRPFVLGSAFALALLVTVAPNSARAQPQDDSVENSNSIWDIEKRVWNGVVRGLGLRSSDSPVIQYRERSPLVVPPTRELPPPQAKAPPRDPSWPVDPDATRASQRAQAKRTVGNIDASRTLDQQGEVLSPTELSRGGNVPGPSAQSPQPTDSDERPPIPPAEAGWSLFSARAWGFGAYRDEVGTFTNEPSRDRLTAPPPGYQTPSPAQPYGNTRRVERSAIQKHDPAR